jgi:REP element-mobilizing transposase RayT
VWGTKERQPLLTSEVEPVIHTFLRVKAIGLEATVFVLNGTEDHVHIVAAIPPKLAVATFVGQIKAVASTKFNKSTTGSQWPFFWQDEYGAFAFDGKRLPNVIAYVEQQKKHHAQRTTIPILARATDGGVGIVRENASGYLVEDAAWRTEMLQLGESHSWDDVL